MLLQIHHSIHELSEHLKRSPDKEKIARRMLLTFPDRRKMVNEKKPINEIKEAYPALLRPSEVRTTEVYVNNA